MASAYGGTIGAYNATPNTFNTNDTNVGRLTEITVEPTPINITTATHTSVITLPVLTQGTYIILWRAKILSGNDTTSTRVLYISSAKDTVQFNSSYKNNVQYGLSGNSYRQTSMTVVVPDGSTAQYYCNVYATFQSGTATATGLYQITQIA